MPMHLEALRQECQRISSVADALTEPDFARPTRLPVWNVKEVLAHLCLEVEATTAVLDELPPAVVQTSAVSYWRSYDPDAEGGPIADAARERAATFASGAELAEIWGEVWRSAVHVASLHDGSRAVREEGLGMTLNDFLETRVVEVTVHGLDLADALGRPAWASLEALRTTTITLDALLGIPAPSALAWDDVTFVEKATGRRPLTSDERLVLGQLANLFPLLR
jgi:uncharacterized protein (TIGR03083 family)